MFMASLFSSVLRFTISFLKAMKLSTAIIWSNSFLWTGLVVDVAHASKNTSGVTPNSFSSFSSSDSTKD